MIGVFSDVQPAARAADKSEKTGHSQPVAPKCSTLRRAARVALLPL